MLEVLLQWQQLDDNIVENVHITEVKLTFLFWLLFELICIASVKHIPKSPILFYSELKLNNKNNT